VSFFKRPSREPTISLLCSTLDAEYKILDPGSSSFSKKSLVETFSEKI